MKTNLGFYRMFKTDFNAIVVLTGVAMDTDSNGKPIIDTMINSKYIISEEPEIDIFAYR
jgi:hypothetical protein